MTDDLTAAPIQSNSPGKTFLKIMLVHIIAGPPAGLATILLFSRVFYEGGSHQTGWTTAFAGLFPMMHASYFATPIAALCGFLATIRPLDGRRNTIIHAAFYGLASSSLIWLFVFMAPREKFADHAEGALYVTAVCIAASLFCWFFTRNLVASRHPVSNNDGYGSSTASQ